MPGVANKTLWKPLQEVAYLLSEVKVFYTHCQAIFGRFECKNKVAVGVTGQRSLLVEVF